MEQMSHVHIPEEIVLQIFPLLPVKTLLRFKSVCKLWRSLISHPKFTLSSKGRERAILGCFILSSTGRERAILGCSRGRPVESGRYLMEQGKVLHSLDHQLSLQQLPNPVGKDFDFKFYFLGSCNGLLLLCASKPLSTGASMYLWNPSTRCLRELNKFYGLIDNSSSFRGESFDALSGLCFDQTSDDYKIVLISETSEVRVASLRREIEWKDVSFPYRIPEKAEINRSGVLINGHLHWLARERIRVRCVIGYFDDPRNIFNKLLMSEPASECVIVYFDETRNIFNKLPMPDSPRSRKGIFGLGDLDGCLFLLISEFSSFHVFIMKEYGVKESWTKVTLFDLPIWLPPLHYTRLGAVILFRNCHRVVAYNLKDNSLKEIELGQCSFIDDGPIEYVESLASVY